MAGGRRIAITVLARGEREKLHFHLLSIGPCPGDNISLLYHRNRLIETWDYLNLDRTPATRHRDDAESHSQSAYTRQNRPHHRFVSFRTLKPQGCELPRLCRRRCRACDPAAVPRIGSNLLQVQRKVHLYCRKPAVQA